jgi:hypothetical protein
LLAELVIGPLLELALEPIFNAAERSRLPLFAVAMILAGGTGIGLLYSAVFTERLVPSLVPGASLVLLPLALGTLMQLFGNWRQAKGHSPTSLATFLGGAALGLGMAAGRLIALIG